MSHHVIESLFRKKTFENVSYYRNHVNLLNFVTKMLEKTLLYTTRLSFDACELRDVGSPEKKEK